MTSFASTLLRSVNPVVSGRRPGFRRIGRDVSVMLAALSLPVALYAPPTGGQVAAGTANIAQNGALTTITASDGAIINYTGFDIAPQETVQFIQPSDIARVLNRVNSENPTNILGTLRANGIVYLVNPAGVYFGQHAFLDVGGLYAAAGNISDQDFLAGSNHFSGLDAGVTNDGAISAGRGVALLGRTVANHGDIVSPGGAVAMLAGDEVYVGEAGQHVFVNLGSAPVAGTGVANSGRVDARGAGGSATLAVGDVYSLAIQQSGEIFAPRVQVDGGAGRAEVSGLIDATNPAGVGGDVAVLGQEVHVKGTAAIDASGAAGGGHVRIGGDFHGANPAVRNAARTAVAQGATIQADALDRGNGGSVVVWADEATSYWGDISARGGNHGGNGGAAEVSGKSSLSFNGGVDLGAAQGANGTLLLDPAVTNIVAPGTGADDAELADGSVLFADGGSGTFNITTTAVVGALQTTDVSIQSTSQVNVLSAIDVGVGAPATSLTLAAPTISLVADVTTGGGQTYQGAVLLGSATNQFVNLTLTSQNGGDITFAPLASGGFNVASSLDIAPTASDGSLTINTAGTSTFSGIVGGIKPISSLTTDAGGTTRINGGSITTAFSQTYGDAVAFGGDTTLTGFNVDFNGGTNSVTGAGTTLTLQPDDPGSSIDVGTTVSEGFDLSPADLDALAAGFTGIVVGRPDGAAGINVAQAGAVFRSRPTFLMPNGGITVSGGNGVVSAAGMGFTAASINLSGDLLSAGGSISMNGGTSLFNATQTIDTTNKGSVPTGADISFSSSVFGSDTDLTLQTGTTGTATFNDDVQALSLAVNGRTALLGSLVNSSGDQTYGGDVVVGPSVSVQSSQSGATLDFLGDITSATGTPGDLSMTSDHIVIAGALGGSGAAALGDVTLSGATAIGLNNVGANSLTANGTTALNGASLVTTAGQQFNGSVTQNTDVTVVANNLGIDGSWDAADRALTLTLAAGINLPGSFANLGSIRSDGAGTTTISASTFTVSDSQSYQNGALRFSGDTTLVSSGNGDITLGSGGTGVEGPMSLTLQTGGTTTLGGAFDVTNLTTDVGGTTMLSGAAITSAGDQMFQDATMVSGGAGSSLDGVNTTFASSVNGATDGQGDLTVDASNAVTFSGAVGGTTRLRSLDVTSGGVTRINGGTVNTAGTQTYHSGVMIGAATSIAASNNAVMFASDINSADATARNLTVDTGTGDILVLGGAGGTNALGAMALNSTGNTSLDNTVRAASLTTNAGGTTTINTTAITTDAAQTFGDNVMVGANATFTTMANGTVQFGGSLDSGSAAARDITVDSGAGSIMLMGATGGTNALGAMALNSTGTTMIANTVRAGSLATNAGGTTAVNTSAVTTTGTQSYGDAVSLGAAATLSTTNSDVMFGASLDSDSAASRDLTVSTGAGDIMVMGAAGGTHALGTMALSSAGVTHLNGSVQAAALATDAGGSTQLNGNVTTSLTQDFNDDVRVDSNLATTASNNPITFAGLVDSQAGEVNDFTVNAGAADVHFDNKVGSTTGGALGDFAVTGDNVVLQDVTTQGNQTYNAANLLFLNSTYNTGGGSVDLSAGANADPNTVSVWKSSQGDLAFNLGGGNISIAPTAGTVVSNGGLAISNPGNVTIGNTTVAQQFTILAPSGQILLTGTQYFAGNIDFAGANATVQLPTGETIIFGTATGTVNANISSANPIAFQIIDPSYLDANFFIQSALLAAGTSLEQALSNPAFLRFPGEEKFTTVAKVDTAKFLAGSLPSQDVAVAPQATISEAQRQQMVQLGIYARPITTEEDRKRLFAHGVYRQLIADATASPDQFEVADVRLSAAAVQAALDQYDVVFGTAGATGAEGSREAELQRLLSDAYYRYVTATPDAQPAGFRDYLADHPDDSDNRAVIKLLDGLTELFRRIERLGLTEKELDISKTKVLQGCASGPLLRALRTIVDQPDVKAASAGPAGSTSA